jgi:hypothetical protein
MLPYRALTENAVNRNSESVRYTFRVMQQLKLTSQ